MGSMTNGSKYADVFDASLQKQNLIISGISTQTNPWTDPPTSYSVLNWYSSIRWFE